MENLAILVLAAGQASRMGRAKQLLPFQGQPLLLHSIQQTAPLHTGYLHVVLGAHCAAIVPLLPEGLPWSENPDWATGMSSSIRCGIEAIERDFPQADAVLILLADQPFIRSAQLQEMIDLFYAQSPPILVAAYAERIGVPALFERALFPVLKALQGDKGARQVFQQWKDTLLRYPLPEAEIDIDTPEDYAYYRSSE